MEQKEIVYRSDYRNPEFIIPEVELYFSIGDDRIRVTSDLTLRYVGQGEAGQTPLILDAEDMTVLSVEIEGRSPGEGEFVQEGNRLILSGLPGSCRVRTVVSIDPYNNTQLMGIYKSGDILCSQCEAEGFRRITPFPDHPDILSRYRVTIEGRDPVLLSNGNLVSEEVRGDRRIVTWEDPFPKPSYLFALVAGDLGHITDTFTTMSGRTIDLRIYTDRGNENRALHAMDCLKKAMKWDEEAYGREYDLDLFMIVAADAFNFGAMENKGLNIFNSALVLADREITTDAGLDRISAIVAHEYFHNWTGNRITCRDWFQLTLKEGLTVFRDQSFSEDTTSYGVSRVEQAIYLKQIQFPEDSGPNSHPIRPESYREIDNFYTPTVYRKGAAVIRMIKTLAGAENYRRGTDEYFRRHDGQAVTCEDFLLAMEQGSGADLSLFRRWYSQAGTPLLTAEARWNGKGALDLTLSQETDPSADKSPKEPFTFPVKAALWDRRGFLIREEQLVMSEKSRTFRFEGLEGEPVLSLLRDFSAPVRMDFKQSREDRLFLLKNETDAYSRYGVSRELFLSVLKGKTETKALLEPLAALLAEPDRELAALLLKLPSLDEIADLSSPPDFSDALKRRNGMTAELGKGLQADMLPLYRSLCGGAYAYDRDGVGGRALKGVLLDYLVGADRTHLSLAEEQYYVSDNMTDAASALRVLCRYPGEEKRKALAHYYEKWKDQFIPLTQWFTYHATAEGDEAYGDVLALEKHRDFLLSNPNRVRALYGGFAANRAQFHHPTGRGYRFTARKVVEMDRINGGVAASLAKSFYRYGQLEGELKTLMRGNLEFILESGCSTGVSEVVENTLKEGR